MELGRVYEIPTWEREQEWTYENDYRYRNIVHSVDFGTFVGNYGSYNLFITSVPHDYKYTYEITYIEYDAEVEETQFESRVPMFDNVVRYVNSRVFPHPEISNMQTTTFEFTYKDVDDYIKKHKYSLNKHITNYVSKRRGTRKAGKKIANWMTALPPLYEIGFTGGPFYKRAEKRFKNMFKGGKTQKLRR
jgi:hypothetical protein